MLKPMKIEWIIEDDDIARVKTFYEKHRDSPFVKLRIERNLRADKPPVSKSEQTAAALRERRLFACEPVFGTKPL
jgi:hypothetical protein